MTEMAQENPQGPTHGLTPHLAIPDARGVEAIGFYTEAFGATEFVRMPADDGVRLMHCHLGINGGSVMLADCFPEYGEQGAFAGAGSMTLHLQVDDTDAWFARAVAAGADPAMPPADMFWGDRYAQVRDPFGYRWAFGTRIGAGG